MKKGAAATCPCKLSADALLNRSSYIFRERFGLSAAHADVMDDAAPEAPAAPGGTGFAAAWRNYVKSVFRKGHMYKISCSPNQILYVAENKTLAGKEDRVYDGEAQGRKMALVFFEVLRGDLVRRVHRETSGLRQILMSIAEVLQTLTPDSVPADPARTAAQTEILFESQYERLDIMRYKCTIEPAAGEAHVFQLTDEVHAEAALVLEVPAEQRTKMTLARLLQREGDLADGEVLQAAWAQSLATLRRRADHLLPAPPVPAPAPVPPAPVAAPPARGRGRGRARGRGGR